MRITRKQLDSVLAIVNRQLDTQLHFEVWSDGTRHYRLMDDSGREYSRSISAAEMYEVLYTLDNVLYRSKN